MPEMCFAIYIILQIILFFSAFLMNQKIDPPKQESDGSSSFFLNTHRMMSEENRGESQGQDPSVSESSQQNSNYNQ